MKKIFFVLSILLPIFSYAKDIPYPKTAGDKGNYFIIEESLEKNAMEDTITLISKRVGVSETGFTKLSISCKNKQYQELGYGDDSIDNLVVYNDSKWVDIVSGSSKSNLVNFVCDNY